MLDLPDKIESERILLERLRYEFAEEIFFAYASKPEATKYVSWPTHRGIDDTRDYLKSAIAGWKEGTDYAYAIRVKPSGQLIGSIGCINEGGKVQFGYILSPSYWNRGMATEACQLLLPALRRQKEIYRIWTFTDVDNVASQRVLLKCGLVEEARLTGWYRFINQNDTPQDCILFKVPYEFPSYHLVSK
jgi:ribosomal-protein-alanine N-acetyltransferase